jgi:hypothetical protein
VTRPAPANAHPSNARPAVGLDRRRLIGWLLGAGLFFIASAAPQERLIGEAFVGRFGHSPLWAIWHRLGGMAGGRLGMLGEQVRFGIAALAYGACVPVALGLARRLGCRFSTGLLATAIVLLSPTAWTAGTTPGMVSISLLLLLMLIHALREAPERGPWRSLWLWGLLVGTQFSTLLLWPAVVIGCRPPRRSGVAGRKANGVGILAGIGVFAVVVGTRIAGWDPVPLPTDLDPSSILWTLDGNTWLRLAGLIPGIGFGLVGLASLCWPRRDPAEHRRPSWLAIWCVGPVAFLLCGSTLTWDASYHWLLPVLLIGLVDLMEAARSARAASIGAVILAAQIALLLGTQSYVSRTDPLAAWRDKTRALIEPLDTVITGDVRHAYLCSHRWGVRSVVLWAADPRDPSTDHVNGIYSDEAGRTNLRIKDQDVAAWADEGIEAHGFGLRPVLDRPFPEPSRGISEALERALEARVEFWPIESQ